MFSMDLRKKKQRLISYTEVTAGVSTTETRSVYCAVRTEYLNIIHVTCSVWISEQTAIVSLYSINSPVYITQTESVYCAVRTEYLNIIHVTCSVWISEQTAIVSLYSIN